MAWPPNARSTPGCALADEVERVAQVEAGDRPPRALEQPVLAAREDEGRPVHAAPSGARRRCRPRLRGSRGRTASAPRQRAQSSAGSSASSSASACSRMPASTSRRSRLMASSCAGQLGGARRVVASRHSMPSVMSASRPAALMRGPSAKPKSKPQWRGADRARRRRTAPPRRRACGRRGCACRPCATRRRLLASSRTTSATVPSATRSSRRPAAAASPRSKHAARAQLAAQREQHVEHHADAGEVLAREAARRLVRVDDHVGIGQPHVVVEQRRQVVVGDDHAACRWRAHAPRRRCWRCRCRPSPAAGRGRGALQRQIDDGRRQAVAVDRAVGNDIAQLVGAAPSSARPRSATAQAVAPSQS